MKTRGLSRRGFLQQAGAVAAVASLQACAGPTPTAKRVPVVGIFPFDLTRTPRSGQTFVDGLRYFGYEDGRSIRIEWRWASDGDIASGAAPIARDLVALPVDVIVAVGGPAQLAAKAATSTIPIVIYSGVDPVEAGLVESLARPGGNVTGVASTNALTDAKRLELLKELSPGMSRVAILTDDTPTRKVRRRNLEEAARALGLEVVILEVRDPSELPRALDAATTQDAHALLLLHVSGLAPGNDKHLLEYAAARRIPASYPTEVWVDPSLRIPGSSSVGGLMSYTNLINQNERRAASYVARILNGEKPAEMAMERPTNFQLVINLKLAREQGFSIPESVLNRATRVIE